MVAFLQIVVFVGTYLKMDEIFIYGCVRDGGSNKRGRFLKSMGRYMVMRKLFGRRYYSGGRRAAVSRSAGNGTGGGTGGNAGSSSEMNRRLQVKAIHRGHHHIQIIVAVSL